MTTDVSGGEPSESGQMRIGRYVLDAPIGSGGHGMVYAARDSELGRRVAIKLLHPERSANDPAGQARLLREARAIASIAHPNVVAIHDVGTFPSLPGLGAAGELPGVFMVMELVDGPELRSWVEEQARGWSEIVDVFVQAGQGLAAAHAAGLVHRDFKPANVVIGSDGRARVLDFGIVRAIEPSGGTQSQAIQTMAGNVRAPDRREIASPDAATKTLQVDLAATIPGDADDPVLTGPGLVMGTPRYMSPEHHRGDPLDARSDVFSFCVALYEALYGGSPFAGESNRELFAAKEAGEVRPPPEGTPTPSWVFELIKAGLRSDPARRPGSIEVLLRQIQRRRRRRGRGVWGLSAGIAIAGVAVAFGLRQQGAVEPIPVQSEAAAQPAALMLETSTLALLPFVDESGDTNLSFAREGVPDILGRELGRVAQLQIVPYYRLLEHVGDNAATRDTWRRVASELGAGAVAWGTLSSDADGIRIELVVERVDGVELHRSTRTATVADLPRAIRGLATEIASTALGREVPLGVSRSPSLEFDRHLQLAIAAVERGEQGAAEKQLQAAERIDPSSGIVHFYLALVTWWLDQPDAQAIEHVEQALAGELAGPQRAFLEGFRPLVQQDYARASASFSDAADRFPEDRYVVYGLFESQFHGGEPRVAAGTYQRLAGISPSFTLGLYHVLEYAAAQGDDELHAWGRQHAGGAGDRSEELHLARIEAVDGRIEQAQRRLRRLGTEDPEHRSLSDTALLESYVLGGDEPMALSLADQLAEGMPGTSTIARLALAQLSGNEPAHRRLRASAIRFAQVTAPGWPRAQAWLELLAAEILYAAPGELERIVTGLEESVQADFAQNASIHLARVLIAHRRTDPTTLERGRESPFPGVRHAAEAYLAEASGNLLEAERAWTAAIPYALDARFVLVEHHELARVRRALGDHPGVIAACARVIEPARFHWSWASAVSPCLAWTAESQTAVGDDAAAAAARQRLAKLRAAG